MKINWEFVIAKFGELGNFLFNKETWGKFIFPLVIAFGVLPYINEANSDVLSEQAVVWAQLIIPIVASLLLGFSKGQDLIEDTTDEWLEKLLESINKQ